MYVCLTTTTNHYHHQLYKDNKQIGIGEPVEKDFRSTHAVILSWYFGNNRKIIITITSELATIPLNLKKKCIPPLLVSMVNCIIILILTTITTSHAILLFNIIVIKNHSKWNGIVYNKALLTPFFSVYFYFVTVVDNTFIPLALSHKRS